ncbi:MAG TPA: hypothetical protein VMT12_16265 [Syntrophales bacterium]|nr:hypothetical protein [Syntrophales bacterium]
MLLFRLFIQEIAAAFKGNSFVTKLILFISLLLITFATLLFPLSFNCNAASDKEVYKMEEMCGKKAHERFTQRNGIIETKNGMMLINYTYHYNKKMNKCFVLLETTNYKNNEAVSNNKELWDINENENYGRFFKYVKDDKPFACKVANRRCTSEYVWNSLIKPYMEE